MTGAGVRPSVSIVTTGRNDGYGGDFVRRFLATLAFNHRALAAAAIEHEFVVVEWAPVRGKPLLIDLVEERCGPSVAAAVRSIVVDAEYHDAVTLNPRLQYHEFLAKNVGIRRAQGTFVVTTNCDVFLGRDIVERLRLGGLSPGTVYRAARYDLRPDLAVERLDWRQLEDPVNLARPPKAVRPPYFGGGAGDFIALDRGGFDVVRGFNEIYRTARIGIDLNFLVQALSCGLAIADIGGPVYHIDHAGSFHITKPLYSGREREAPYGDERWPAGAVTYRNPASWGLAEAPSRPLGLRRTHLDFSWTAVPSLVDLSGVVLPVFRGHDVPAALPERRRYEKERRQGVQGDQAWQKELAGE